MSPKPVQILYVSKKQKPVENKAVHQKQLITPLFQKEIQKKLAFDDVFVRDRDLMPAMVIKPKKPVQIFYVSKKQPVEKKPIVKQSISTPLFQKEIEHCYFPTTKLIPREEEILETLLIGPTDFEALEEVPERITPDQQIKVLRERINSIINILNQIYTDNVINPKPPIIEP
mgnify:CR=1 FL=1